MNRMRTIETRTVFFTVGIFDQRLVAPGQESVLSFTEIDES